MILGGSWLPTEPFFTQILPSLALFLQELRPQYSSVTRHGDKELWGVFSALFAAVRTPGSDPWLSLPEVWVLSFPTRDFLPETSRTIGLTHPSNSTSFLLYSPPHISLPCLEIRGKEGAWCQEIPLSQVVREERNSCLGKCKIVAFVLLFPTMLCTSSV